MEQKLPGKEEEIRNINVVIILTTSFNLFSISFIIKTEVSEKEEEAENAELNYEQSSFINIFKKIFNSSKYHFFVCV